MFFSFYDDSGQVSASAVFHEDVVNARLDVSVSFDVSYNVFVMKIFEDVASEGRRRCAERKEWVALEGKVQYLLYKGRRLHFVNHLFPLLLTHHPVVEFFACKNL